MSQLHPQIRSHRAMAESLGQVAAECGDETIGLMLARMSQAHGMAADALEAGERELEARIRPPKPPPTKS